MSKCLCLWVRLSLLAGKLLQSCPTLCDPIDSSPLGSLVPGILQARTLEWAAISFSNAWKWKVKVKSLSPVRLFATPWTAAYQAPPSMGLWQQKTQATKAKGKCVRAHRNKKFCASEKPMKIRTEPTEWEKLIAKHISGKRLVFIILRKNSHN